MPLSLACLELDLLAYFHSTTISIIFLDAECSSVHQCLEGPLVALSYEKYVVA